MSLHQAWILNLSLTPTDNSTKIVKQTYLGLTHLAKFEAKSSIDSRRSKATARIKRRF